MKWILYAGSAAAILVGVIGLVAGAILQELVASVFLLIGTSSFGFAAVAGKLNTLAKREDDVKQKSFLESLLQNS